VATFSARKPVSIHWTIIVVNDIDVIKDRALTGADAATEPAAAITRTKMLLLPLGGHFLAIRHTKRKKKEKKRIEQK